MGRWFSAFQRCVSPWTFRIQLANLIPENLYPLDGKLLKIWEMVPYSSVCYISNSWVTDPLSPNKWTLVIRQFYFTYPPKSLLFICHNPPLLPVVFPIHFYSQIYHWVFCACVQVNVFCLIWFSSHIFRTKWSFLLFCGWKLLL